MFCIKETIRGTLTTMKHKSALIRACKIHILLGLGFVAQIIVYDSGKLITPDVVLKRWIVTALLIVSASACWYLARARKKPSLDHRLVWFLVFIDVALASFYVYTGRGMASRAVILFILPILVAGILQQKGAIYLAAVISIAAYIVTAVAYFVLNFNEGYKLELYGEIGFYSTLLLVGAGLTWSLVNSKQKN